LWRHEADDAWFLQAVFLVAVSIGPAACAQQACYRDDSRMKNIDLVKALHGIWNTGDLALIDNVYAHDFLAHWPISSEVPERRGIEGIRFGVARIRTAFPDWHEQVLDVFGSGDRVASRYVSTGTHEGTFWDIEPTGRRIEIQEISIFRFADDRIVEQWCMFDDLARLRQLGVSVEHLRKVLKI
jgi:predicted ester cyclase